MDLSAGARLGPYEVVGQLGEGGMGQVYRARDARLGRDVAVKVLPPEFAADADRLTRFQREAQALAALNHPHIAAIYGVEESAGQRALVLELVDGPTLAEQMAAGPIALDDALLIARQIADALEAAHDRGIIHRDLKPANVKLTRDGKVKVLDFGLAAISAGGAEAASAAVSHSPTLTLAATRAGIILGTAGYMAPEQAAGRNVDRRADVWSFGVVLWEMVTGRRLFEGETVSHTLADVLRAPIDFTQLPVDVPPFLRELLRRCLDRDPATRLRDIGEARVALQQYLANPAAPSARSAPDQPHRGATIPWTLAGAAAVIAALLAFVHFQETVPGAVAMRFQIQPPPDSAFTNGGVVSPDGTKIVFDAPGKDGRQMLWVRELDSLETRPLAGTEFAAAAPFWSPDSRSIGFGATTFPRRLKRVDLDGGPPQTLAELAGAYREGSWNAAGDILFGDSSVGLLRVRASGGQPVPVTQLDRARGEVQHAGATFLPDGKRFLYYRAGRAPEHRGIFVGSLDVPPDRQSRDRLLASDSNPVHATTPDGAYLLFLRSGSLLAQAFDGSTVNGDPVQIAADVGSLGSHGWYSASNTGLLVFRTGRAAGENADLVWLDRQGKRVGQLGSSTDATNGIQLSPDGRKVVTARPEGNVAGAVTTVPGNRLWVGDVARGVFGKVTTDDAIEGSPAFAPDGQIAFTSTLNGAVGDLYRVSSSGVGTPEPLLVKSPTVKHPNDVSPDGRFLIYDDHTPTQFQDLFVLPLDGTSVDRKPIPFVATAADETFGQFSPDGRWIAYSTNEGGRREVVVQGFAPDRVPAAAVGKWIISSAGGDKPRWSANGRELYYIALDRKLMVVPIKPGATFEPGVALPLFELPVFISFFPYDVAPDGRFLVSAVRDAATVRVSPLTVQVNWPAAMKR